MFMCFISCFDNFFQKNYVTKSIYFSRLSVRELKKLGCGSRLRPKRIQCMRKIADTKSALAAHHQAIANRVQYFEISYFCQH
jgi:hypothetical protein